LVKEIGCNLKKIEKKFVKRFIKFVFRVKNIEKKLDSVLEKLVQHGNQRKRAGKTQINIVNMFSAT